MNKRNWNDALVFAGLVVLGLATRLVPYGTSLESWNLNAVTAVALFAGFYFRNPLVAVSVPALTMLLGDLYIQKYHVGVMSVVYAAQLLPVVLGPWLRSNPGVLRVGGAAVAASLVFFVVTNGAYWWGYLPHTTGGLMKAYVDGLPFFRGTLLGNVVFSAGLFGAYALAVSGGWLAARSRAAEAPSG